jgi:hypothetical protein
MVLLYQQALEALSVLMTANWDRLRWEGWMKYPDGRHGHPLGGVREQMLNEKREKHGQITFSAQCICVVKPSTENNQHGMPTQATLTWCSVFV